MKRFFLISFILISAWFHFFKLGQTPSSLTPDEAAQGYTAYAYLQTGHDEWGNKNPFIFQSFGDYKPPLQTWLIMVSVKFLGLNTLSVRLPSAIFGFITLLMIYLISKKLFSPTIAMVSLVLAASSTWLFSLSRLGLEANIVIAIFLLGFYFLLEPIRLTKIFFSAICFGRIGL